MNVAFRAPVEDLPPCTFSSTKHDRNSSENRISRNEGTSSSVKAKNASEDAKQRPTDSNEDLMVSCTLPRDIVKPRNYVIVDRPTRNNTTSTACTNIAKKETEQERAVFSFPDETHHHLVTKAGDGKTRVTESNRTNGKTSVEIYDDEALKSSASASPCPSTTFVDPSAALLSLPIVAKHQEQQQQQLMPPRPLFAAAKNKENHKSMEVSTTTAIGSSDAVVSSTVVGEPVPATENEPKTELVAADDEHDNDNATNQLEPDGSLRLSASAKMDALVAAATAEMDAIETATGAPSESQDKNQGDEQAVDSDKTEAKDLHQPQQPQESRTKEGPEEEKKESTTLEDALDKAPTLSSDVPNTEATREEEIVDKVENSEESLEPETVLAVEDAVVAAVSAAVANTNDSHSAAATANNDAIKIPVDASGFCSIEPDKGSEDSNDPPETIVEETKQETLAYETANPTVVSTGAAVDAREDNSAPTIKSVSTAEAIPTESMPTQTPKITNTKKPIIAVPQSLELDESEAGDVPMPSLTNGDAAPKGQMPRDLLLANKDKEGFGLLARGESFNGVQQQDFSPQHVYVDQHGRAPRQDPDAEHRRGDSSLASVAAPVPTATSIPDDSGNRLLDENSGRPIDDWRPSQVMSYPASPQGITNSQAISYANGGYVMVQPPRNHSQAPAPHAFMPQPPSMLHHQSSFHSQQSHLIGQSFAYQTMPQAMAPIPPSPLPASVGGGKRKIKLRLQEEIVARPSHERRTSFFFGRSSSKTLLRRERTTSEGQVNEVDRGTITVSWFEGTSSLELQDHVTRSVSRKLKLESGQTLDDIRILDTKSDPPEEIVLCPYIPSGSEFLLRYKLKSEKGNAVPAFYGPPDSPSAAPSPFPSHGNLGSLDADQLAILRKQLDAVQEGESRGSKYKKRAKVNRLSPVKLHSDLLGSRNNNDGTNDEPLKETRSRAGSDHSDNDNESETNTLQPESGVDAKLRQITELLLMDKQKAQQQQLERYPQVEKRDVIFVMANYFVLFVAFITIMAEMQARAPQWLSWMETQLKNVHNCSADQDALFECVSNGEFAGLFASVILWLSRSVLARRFFLLGFDSPQKLWTVFYESLVGAFCWGVSYMFIRRGMNPDTRPQFLQRYWRDAMYGSLAGFNATFMKQVLKNLIPQEAVEEAFNDRQLKILSWLPTFS